jgi:proton-dependent oligopeptide transporter, POT family
MSKTLETVSYPKSIPYIIGNEAAERFNYYGIRAILSTFLVAQFFNPSKDPALSAVAEAKSNEISHIFVTVSYFMPMIGGLIADWFFGKYRTILYISMLYCFGVLMVALNITNLTPFQWGLFIVACGAGGIKSCVSANVGDQFDKSNQHLMSKVYGWFYFSINAGSVLSTALIPWIYKNYGAALAFGLPGLLMVFATFTFWLGRKDYVRVPPAGFGFDAKKMKEGLGATSRALLVFMFIPLFWAMWDQCLAEWVLQATKMDLTVWSGFTLLPEQVQTVNPFFLVSLIPVFTYFIYPFFEKIGIKTTPLRRIGLGLAFTAVSFVVIAMIQERIDIGEKPSMWWQVLAYFILSIGEILVSITGLEYAYTQAPKYMKSMMTAIFYLMVAIGNFFVAFMNNNIASGGYFSKYTGASYYWFFVALMAGEVVIFMLISSFLKEKSYIGIDDDSELAAQP